MVKGRRETRKITEVVAALIFKGGRFLICQRPANKARGLLWEFAGGKVEAGESKEEALIRECREELGVTLKALMPYMEVFYKYPDICVRLTVFKAGIAEGEPRLLEHAAMKWITPEEIKYYTFCPADRKILKKIKRDNLFKSSHNKNLGADGEKKAVKYLTRRGYKILKRNMRTPFGEVDVVAETQDILVFCEVKTRSNDLYGRPAEAVNSERRIRYVRAAEFYLKKQKKVCTVRFDVIEVLNGQINHIENAFEEV